MSAPAGSREIDPLVDPVWDDLNNRGGTLFSSTQWLTAVSETYGLKPRALVNIGAGGDPTAGIAFCRIDDMLGSRVVSFPFSDFHDPVGDPNDAAGLLAQLLADHPESVRFRIPEDRLPAGVDREFPLVQRALLHHIIPVPDMTADERFGGLHTQVRQNIRKSRRAGVEVEMRTDIEAVRQFYEMHVAVRTRKYRLLPQPWAFFEQIHAAFAPQDRVRIALAHLGGRCIAGIFYIEWGDTLYYKFNASNTDGLKVRPNELLVWAGMEHCVERGLVGIDLGVSDIDQPGLVRYKRKFSDQEQEVVTLSRPATTPVDDVELRKLLNNLTDLLTDERVPASVAEEAGSLLYRYFT